MLEWYLETESNDADLTVCIPLNECREYTIGRKRGFDIVTSNPLVSRTHGVITVRLDNIVLIKDTNSSNGIWINDIKVSPCCDHVLHSNDLIGIGAPSTAQEPKKELFRIRSRALRSSCVSPDIIIVNNADSSTNNEEFSELRVQSSSIRDSTITEQCDKGTENVLLDKIIESDDISIYENSFWDNEDNISGGSSMDRNVPIQKVCKSNMRQESMSDSDLSNDNNIPVSKVPCNSTNAKKRFSISESDVDISCNNNEKDKSKKLKLTISKLTHKPKLSDNAGMDPNSKNLSSVSNTGQQNQIPETASSKVEEDEPHSKKNISKMKVDSKNISSVNNSDQKNQIPESASRNVEEHETRSKKTISEVKVDLNSKNIFSVSNIDQKNQIQETASRKVEEDKTQSKKNISKVKVDLNSKNISSVSNTEQKNQIQESASRKMEEDKTQSKKNISKVKVDLNSKNISSVSNTDQKNQIADSASRKVEEHETQSKKTIPNVKVDLNSKHTSSVSNTEQKNQIPESASSKVEEDEIQFKRNISNVKDCTVLREKSNETNSNETKQNEQNEKSSSKITSSWTDKFMDVDGYFTSDLVENRSYPVSENIEPKFEVKQEINYSFSTDEVILLSDDEDIFPKSQLFDDDIIIKNEQSFSEHFEQNASADATPEQIDMCPLTTSECFDDNSGIIKKDIEFDNYNSHDDDDSEDDCIIWFNKLSQSQDKTSSTQDFDRLKERTSDENNEQKFDKLLSILDENDLEIELNKDYKLDMSDEEEKVDINGKSVFADEIEVDRDTDDDIFPQKEKSPDVDNLVPSTSSSLSIDKVDETFRNRKDPLQKSYLKPPVIDAPFLPRGRIKAREDPKPKETRKGRKRKHSPVELPTPPVTSHPTTPSDKFVKSEFDKRHKNQKKQMKSSKPLPKTQKQEIQNERKKKLKELAAKKEVKKENNIQKHKTKPKVKVSNSRGLFLTDEDPGRESEKIKKGKVVTEPELELSKNYKIPKKNDTVKQINNSWMEVNRIDLPSTSKVDATSNKLLNRVSHQKPIIKPFGEIEKRNELSIKKVKKTVRFNDTPQIKEFFIDEGNSMHKCTFKDAPIPKAPKNTGLDTRMNTAPENDIIHDILTWVPMWLEEQKNCIEAPTVSVHKPLQMLHTFNTPGDYCNIVIPLMLLELWRSVFKDWNNSNIKYPVILACVDGIKPLPAKINLLSLQCHCVITRDESERRTFLGRGDLIIVEVLIHKDQLNSNKGRVNSFIKKFGYVTDVTKRRLTKQDMVNRNRKFKRNIFGD